MVIGRVNKHSSETLPITVDYTGQLPASTTVSGISLASIKKSTGTSDTDVLSQNTSGFITSVTTTSATFHVTGGVNGEAYYITVITSLSDSNPTTTLYDHIILTITDTPWD